MICSSDDGPRFRFVLRDYPHGKLDGHYLDEEQEAVWERWRESVPPTLDPKSVSLEADLTGSEVVRIKMIRGFGMLRSASPRASSAPHHDLVASRHAGQLSRLPHH